MNYKTIEDAKYYIAQFKKDIEKSQSVKQKKYYAGIVNTFIDLIDLKNNQDDSSQAPNSYELEQSVLGAMMVDEKAVTSVIGKLNDKVFYNSKNRQVFIAINNLHKNNKPIDLLTVSDELHRTKKIGDAGTDVYLIDLTQIVSSSAHVDFHTHILLQFFIRRYYIKLSEKIKGKALKSDVDIFELIEYTTKKTEKINNFIKTVGEWSRK